MTYTQISLGNGQILAFEKGKVFYSTPDKTTHIEYENVFTFDNARTLLSGTEVDPRIAIALYQYLIFDDEWVEVSTLDNYHHLKAKCELYTKNGTRIYFVNKTRYNQYKLVFEGGLHTFLSEHAIVRKVKR